MSNTCLPIHSSNYLGDTGRCSAKKELTLSEVDLFFQLTLEGDRTPAQSVTVTNTGKAPVQIKKVVLTRGTADFVLVNANNYPATLRPGENFQIIVDFTARVDGRILGLLEIYTNEDRLPYVLGLSSRVRMADDEDIPSDLSIRDLYARIEREVRMRASEDIRINSEITARYVARIDAERDQRTVADNLEIVLRSTQDDGIRLLARNLTDAEAAIRFAADEELRRRLALVEQNQSDNTVFGVDGLARAMIRDELIVRANADEAEAIARRTLEASFGTAISEANAKIVEESRVYANRYEALATRTVNIEATYQTAGQVQTIADARMRIEQLARATAISAESSIRESQLATLRTTVNNGLTNESIVREAAIQVERNALATLASSTATSLLSLTARMSGGRGIILNGTFMANRPNWSGLTFVANGAGGFTPTSAAGAFETLSYTEMVLIDPTRAFQINAQLTVSVAAALTYVGIQCYDASLTFLGNIYAPGAAGHNLLGPITVAATIAGEADYPVPTYREGDKFPRGTRYIRPIALANYPSNGVSAPGSITRFTSFWVDDITNSYSVNARLTLVEKASSDADQALTQRISTAESNYTTAKNRLDAIDAVNVGQNLDVIAANARITLEENTRANSLMAEATRVNTLIANYETIGSVNSKISSAITSEQSARSSAIEAEARRVDGLLTSYATNGAVGFQINAAIVSEQSARSTAIAAEAARVDRLMADVITGGAVDSKISAAIQAEQVVRANADEALTRSVESLSASYVTASGNMVPNSDFVTTDGWSTGSHAPGGPLNLASGLNIAGDSYHPSGENVLSFLQHGAPNGGDGSAYMDWYSPSFPVKPGEYIQFYCLANCHRAQVQVILAFRDINGVFLSAIHSAYVGPISDLGNSLSNYARVGVKASQVPGGAVSAYLILRKLDTIVGQADSYAWFLRPYVGAARDGQTSWNPYAVGRASPVIIAANAAIKNEATARAGAVAAEALRVDSLLVSYATGTALAAATSAEIASRNQAISSAVAAEASRVDQLLANYSGGSQVDQKISAAISTERDVRVAAEGAIANSVEQVRGTAGSASTTASSALSVAQGANGKSDTALARWAVRLDANGYISGVEQNNTGATASMTIRSDTFAIVSPGGGRRTEYSNGNWRTYDENGTLRTRSGIW